MKSHKTLRVRALPLLLITALMAGFISARASAATLVVTTTADPGTGGCTAAGSGDGCTLREAIIAANDQTLTPGDDTIDATGISGTISLSTALPPLGTNIVLNGPGAAKLTVQRSSAGGTPEFRIFTIDNTTTSGPTVSLAGLTILGGKVSGENTATNSGGGIYNNHGMLTVSHCVLKNNAATNGGAIGNDGSLSVQARLTLDTCTISGNTASQGGGGLFNNGSGGGSAPLTVSNSSLTGNHAVNGAGILNDGHQGGSATITDFSHNVISDNVASGNGGALENDGTTGGSATLVISYSTVATNTAINGGAIDNNGVAGSATQAFTFSTFSGNKASGNGGAIDNVGGTAGSGTLTAGASTFTANTATGRGGAINNDGAGGSATVEIDNSTLKTNAASQDSAAIDSDGTGGSATLAIGSTILDNGTGANIILTVNSATTFTSKNHNLSSDAAGGDGTSAPGGPYLNAGGDIRNTDAKLGVLQFNGGPTQTMALLQGSPAIDQGLSSFPTDQRGFGLSGPADIGAFEFGGVAPGETSPTVSIATPATGGAYTALRIVSGTTADNSGSGIAKVEVILRRLSDLKYWSGSAWGTSAVTLSTALSGNDWHRVSGLPAAGTDTATQLTEGKYMLLATVTDKAGNHSAAAARSDFTIDRTAPTAVITAPATGNFFKTFTSVSGTAADNAGGAGVARVDLVLRRVSDYKYWSGSTWVTAATSLVTNFNGTTWYKGSGLPIAGTDTATQLTEGKYILLATATDKAGNSNSPGARSDITIDRTAPAVTITAPATTTTVTSLAPRGTATDAGGVTRVDLTLRRVSDYKSWNGETWVTASATLPAVLSGTTWSKTTSLPVAGPDAATQLTPGKYILLATATDNAGNITSPAARSDFSVASAQASAAVRSSAVQLSSIRAASGGTIQLTFTGALSEAATDSANYSVTQSGALEVSSVKQSSSGVVVLTTDSLASGSQVTVSYNLQDASGAAVAGSATATVR